MAHTRLMARTAVTLSISMPPRTRSLLESLRKDRSASEYVRRLVEEDAARRALHSPSLAELELAEARRDLPDAWLLRELPDPLEDARAFPSAGMLAGSAVSLGALAPADLRPAAH